LIKFNNKLLEPVEINKGLRQSFPLSLTLFNIHLDEIITKRKNEDITGIYEYNDDDDDDDDDIRKFKRR